MADQTPKSYHTDPNLYLYTSLTAGSSQIITATSRMETILKANKIRFQALDVATDEKARMLWGRRAGKRKLPGLVRMGMIVGDLEEVEEWNEYGELRDNVEPGPKPAPSAPATPSKAPTAPSLEILSKAPATNPVTPSKPPALVSSTETPPRAAPSSTDSPLTTAMRQAGFEAARKAGDAKSKARAEALQASKAQADTPTSETLQKLDNSSPTGMPPPSGATEAGEALKPETGNTSAEGNADDVPVTEEGKGEAEEEGKNSNVHGLGAMDADKVETDGKETKMLRSKKAEDSATEATVASESEEVLEGRGQAESFSEDIPNSKEVEEAANASIMHDKSHIVLVGSREADRTPPSEPVDEKEELSDPKEKDGSKLKEATNVSDEGQGLPGDKTQDQPAASGVEAGNSVAD
ncbi:hypothetical protein HO133_003492 [Letharia lupina]|uniref:Uncharacterized protein n=1 Tax=Letharia lupina TaxID=560253 RepID=A0A8H6CBG4_9LECA|nr:uncharacterized protein HO133_003492 [Letharia lupina]KAF6220360.1 hypothetical protein HO133_003492 [Letharia lupina]